MISNSFKEWLELDEGLGSFMIPMMLGAQTPAAPPAPKQQTVEQPKIDIEEFLSGPKFDKSMKGELVALANKTLSDLDVLEDNLASAVTNTTENPEELLQITPNNSVTTVHQYIDELRARLNTFTHPENFDNVGEVFHKQPLEYITRWMNSISKLKKLSEANKTEAYKKFINDYPNLFKSAENRAKLIRMAHSEDSKDEFEGYKDEIEKEIAGKRNR